MDRFSTDDLSTLIDWHTEGPTGTDTACVSLYALMIRAGREVQQNEIRF